MALAARFVPWRSVFTPEGIRFLGDGDPYYHVLRAGRIAAAVPDARWSDPWLEHPLGAEIPWPPLLDDLIAAIAVAVARGSPDVGTVALVSAGVPVAFGLATIGVFAAVVARLWGREASVGAAFVLALSPSHVLGSVIGRPDHHVVEVFSACCALLAWTVSWGSPRGSLRARGGMLLTALAIALASWVWPGSVLHLVFLGAITATAFAIAPVPHDGPGRMAGSLAGASALAALALGASSAALAPAGRWMRIELTSVSGFHILMLATFATYGGLLAGMPRHRSVAARLASVTAAAGAAAAVSVAIASGVVGEAARAFAAIGVKSAWYAGIGEFAPVVLSTYRPLVDELSTLFGWSGAMPLFAAVGALELRDRWRDDPEARLRLVALGTWALLALLLGLARYRFVPYAAPPVALMAWLGIRRAARALPGLAGPGWSIGFRAIALTASCIGLVPVWRSMADPAGNRAAPLLVWLAEQPVPAGPVRGVLAEWSLGHHVQYLGRRPTVASPFGTELRRRGFEDAMAFLLTQDEERAENILASRAVGHVLTSDPWPMASVYWTFAPPGEPPLGKATHHWRRGLAFESADALSATMMYRLHRLDGGGNPLDGSSVPGLRLVNETDPCADRTPEYKLFEVVAGAPLSVSGAPPSSDVSVLTSIRTRSGRAFTWRSTRRADASGRTVLRVPYATGRNGLSDAGPYELRAGSVAAVAHVPEAAVASGAAVPVVLLPAADELLAKRRPSIR